MKMTRAVSASVVSLLLLAGCGRSPQVTFYTLTPTTMSEVSTLVKAAPIVTIASVTLPELVDRPQLVMPDEGARVSILEAQRWAEPLKSAIPRILAEDLSRLMGAGQVSYYPQHAANEADYRAFVDIQRFEVTGNAVAVEAVWSIRDVKEGGRPISGRAKILEPIGATGYEAVVAAYSRALAAVSKEIVQSIRTL